MSRRVLWMSAVVGGVALTTLEGLFLVVGLDMADEIASILGVFSGLVVAGVRVILAKRAAAQPPEPGVVA